MRFSKDHWYTALIYAIGDNWLGLTCVLLSVAAIVWAIHG